MREGKPKQACRRRSKLLLLKTPWPRPTDTSKVFGAANVNCHTAPESKSPQHLNPPRGAANKWHAVKGILCSSLKERGSAPGPGRRAFSPRYCYQKARCKPLAARGYLGSEQHPGMLVSTQNESKRTRKQLWPSLRSRARTEVSERLRGGDLLLAVQPHAFLEFCAMCV